MVTTRGATPGAYSSGNTGRILTQLLFYIFVPIGLFSCMATATPEAGFGSILFVIIMAYVIMHYVFKWTNEPKEKGSQHDSSAGSSSYTFTATSSINSSSVSTSSSDSVQQEAKSSSKPKTLAERLAPRDNKERALLAFIAACLLMAFVLLCVFFDEQQKASNQQMMGARQRLENRSNSSSSAAEEQIEYVTVTEDGYASYEERFEADVSAYGNNQYKAAYAKSLSRLKSLRDKSSQEGGSSRITRTEAEELLAQIERDRSAYVDEGEAELQREREEAARIAEEEARKAAEAAYVDPPAYSMQLGSIEMEIELTRQMTSDMRTYEWDQNFDVYQKTDLERVKAETSYLRGQITADDLYQAVRATAEARKTMVLGQGGEREPAPE